MRASKRNAPASWSRLFRALRRLRQGFAHIGGKRQHFVRGAAAARGAEATLPGLFRRQARITSSLVALLDKALLQGRPRQFVQQQGQSALVFHQAGQVAHRGGAAALRSQVGDDRFSRVVKLGKMSVKLGQHGSKIVHRRLRGGVTGGTATVVPRAAVLNQQ